MSLLSGAFGAAVKARNSLYDRGLLRVRRLNVPVVSVGNVSVGGAGKTPFTIALGEELKKRGVRLDVLSRGYGRQTSGTLIVDPNGTAQEFGDEPLLIARKLAVPVVVSEKRYDAGIVGEREFRSELHLLDDGFQHRMLARDFDIVLLTARDLSDKLLPSGRLREPLTALRRADAIVMYDDLALPRGVIKNAVIWRAHREMDTSKVPPGALAFCAIARPDTFFKQLKNAGVRTAAEFAFRDHRAYIARDLEKIHQLAKQVGASGFVTTEKDVINLGSLAGQLAPLHMVPLQTKIKDPDTVVQTLLDTLERRRASRA
jgi:tetraacyldisaccharide 4'-kinase